jgi:hypothetical protein
MESLWVILVDTSSSMAEGFSGTVQFDGITDITEQSTKINAAKESLVRAVKGLTYSDVAIIAFNDQPTLIFYGLGDNPELCRNVETLQPNGGTDIGRAIEYANQDFPRRSKYQSISFLLISDGLSNEVSASQSARRAFMNNIRISTILIDPTPEGERLAREISLGGDIKAVTSAAGLNRAIDEQRPIVLVPAAAEPHMKAARALHILIVSIFGILALTCIGGGIYAIVVNSVSKTEIDIFGAQISTGHVGVALVGIGLVITFFTIRAVLTNLRELAELPLDSPRKRRRKRKA